MIRGIKGLRPTIPFWIVIMLLYKGLRSLPTLIHCATIGSRYGGTNLYPPLFAYQLNLSCVIAGVRLCWSRKIDGAAIGGAC